MARARLWQWRRTRRRADAWVPGPAAGVTAGGGATRGAVEQAGPVLRGWAQGAASPLRVEVRAGEEVLGSGLTALARPDLDGGPHGFAIACSRPVAAREVMLGAVQVCAVAPDGARVALPLAEHALAAVLLELLRGAAPVEAAALDALSAALQAHPILARRREAAERARAGTDRVADAGRLAARLSALPPQPAPPGARDHPELPAGHVAPDGSAAMGHGGHAFLLEGSNGVIGQYLRRADEPWVAGRAAAWTALLARRAETCARLGARFVQLGIPEKASVLPDFLPCALAVPTPLWRALEGRFLSALPVLSARGLREAAFPKLDTHLTARGAYAVFAALCAAMELGRPFPEAPFTRDSEEIGDLAARLLPGVPLPETYHWPMPELLALLPVPELIEDVAPADPAHHTGRRLVWRTHGAPVDRRVVAFGNSFFERGGSPRALSWWAARAFREFHFVWSAELDETYVQTHRPDWVVCQTTERFLPQVPGR